MWRCSGSWTIERGLCFWQFHALWMPDAVVGVVLGLDRLQARVVPRAVIGGLPVFQRCVGVVHVVGVNSGSGQQFADGFDLGDGTRGLFGALPVLSKRGGAG